MVFASRGNIQGNVQNTRKNIWWRGHYSRGAFKGTYSGAYGIVELMAEEHTMASLASLRLWEEIQQRRILGRTTKDPWKDHEESLEEPPIIRI
ncbi:hypothetical protein F8M41_001245 [Gigaspora margarita]|uniref:Uncharacterized protein n=1 Tax=Gigaspora margarita TaxID=4874 RepID=A0A8H3XEQ1_GIGMA|nr:hypothetical protein F8M41_001245 [Gigaspora margarita]